MPMLRRSNTANGMAPSSRGEVLHADSCGRVYADYSESALSVFGDKKNPETGTR